MFSDVVTSALETDVIGQQTAVRTIVPGVIRVASGLTPRERTFAAYMLMGPTGTGKTHLIQTLARALHGDQQRVLVADCSSLLPGDAGTAFAARLAPLFVQGRSQDPAAPLAAPPLSIVQVEFLERGPREVSLALAAALEVGELTLPDGRRASLRNCLIFITSGLCAKEILDEPSGIGFSGPSDDEVEPDGDDAGRLYELCLQQAEQTFGSDLLGRIDDFVIFHRLREEHLTAILARRIQRLDEWLARRDAHCEVLPAARRLLLERGRRDLRLGARHLLRAHRELVEFPIADILVSGRLPPGGVVVVDRQPDEDHLHFMVQEPRRWARLPSFVRTVPLSATR